MVLAYCPPPDPRFSGVLTGALAAGWPKSSCSRLGDATLGSGLAAAISWPRLGLKNLRMGGVAFSTRGGGLEISCMASSITGVTTRGGLADGRLWARP